MHFTIKKLHLKFINFHVIFFFNNISQIRYFHYFELFVKLRVGVLRSVLVMSETSK